MLVFVVVFYIVVAGAFTAVGIRDREVGDIVEVRLQCRLASAVFADIGKGDVGGGFTLLRHLAHRVAFRHSLIGLEIILEFHIRIERVVLGATNLVVIVDVEWDVYSPVFGKELAHLEVEGGLKIKGIY